MRLAPPPGRGGDRLPAILGGRAPAAATLLIVALAVLAGPALAGAGGPGVGAAEQVLARIPPLRLPVDGPLLRGFELPAGAFGAGTAEWTSERLRER